MATLDLTRIGSRIKLDRGADDIDYALDGELDIRFTGTDYVRVLFKGISILEGAATNLSIAGDAITDRADWESKIDTVFPDAGSDALTLEDVEEVQSAATLTKEELDTAINANTLKPGQLYRITGAASSSGLYNELFLRCLTAGTYKYEPDFAGVGDYSGINALTGLGTYRGVLGVDFTDQDLIDIGDIFLDGSEYRVLYNGGNIASGDSHLVMAGDWDADNEGDYVINQVVRFGGKHYAVKDAGLFNGESPYTMADVAYSEIPVTSASLTLGIIRTLATKPKLALQGHGLFYVPDYQAVGDYSGVPAETENGNYLGEWDGETPRDISIGDIEKDKDDGKYYVAKEEEAGATSEHDNNIAWAPVQHGLWNANMEPVVAYTDNTDWNENDIMHSDGNKYKALTFIEATGEPFVETEDWEDLGAYNPLVNNNVVIYNGQHCLVKDIDSANGSNPFDNSDAYLFDGDYQVSDVGNFNPNIAVLVGFIPSLDLIHYDYENDWLARRACKRGNIVEVNSNHGDGEAYSLFQWGNNNVAGNIINNSVLLCINNTVSIENNILQQNAYVDLLNTGGNFNKNIIKGQNLDLSENTDSIENRIYDGITGVVKVVADEAAALALLSNGQWGVFEYSGFPKILAKDSTGNPWLINFDGT